MNFKLYKPNSYCLSCGSCCCKHIPGIFHPEQFNNQEEIKALLLTGDYAIDCWEAENSIYYLRPATTNGESIFDFSWGGQCIFLTQKGCKLNRENMPAGCLGLKPKKKKIDHCKARENEKYLASLEWLNSKYDLEKIGNKIMGENK